MIVRDTAEGPQAVTARIISAPPLKGSKAKARRISRRTAERLAREGRTSELESYGVTVAAREAVPDGKRATGWTLVKGKGGKIVQRPTLEDIPVQEERTTADKLADMGLSVDELASAIEASK